LVIPAFQLSSGLPKAAPPAPDFGKAENFAGVKSLPLARASRAVPKLQLLFLCHPFERKQPQETYASAPILQNRDELFLQILLPPRIGPPIHMLRRRQSELCRSADLRLLSGSLSVAKDVTAICDDIALVNANSEINSPLIGDLGIAHGHPLLDFRGAPNGIYDARKLCQKAIACVFDDTSAILPDFRFNQFMTVGF
jgi:hypothetical protein